MKTRTKVLAGGGITLLIGLIFLLAKTTSCTRWDIRVDTGEMRPTTEYWAFKHRYWAFFPGPAQATVVTPVLAKYDLGMKTTGNPWVFFYRDPGWVFWGYFERNPHVRLELAPRLPFYPKLDECDYGGILSAMAKYRSPQEASLWWKILVMPRDSTDWWHTQLRRGAFMRRCCAEKSDLTSKKTFDLWWKNAANTYDYYIACELIPELNSIAPPPQP